MKLSATNIMKSYRGRTVVKGISLEVNQGEIVGLLGPNGAGKTTSFYMIIGFIICQFFRLIPQTKKILCIHGISQGQAQSKIGPSE